LYNVAIKEHTVVSQVSQEFVSAHPELALTVLGAASVTIASEKKQVPLTEICLESDWQINTNWNRLISSLNVPDLGHEIFLEECVNVGAMCTLYTFCLQILRRNVPQQTTRLLYDLLKWIRKLEVAKGKEYKILLLWNKAVELLHSKLLDSPLDTALTLELEYLGQFMLKLGEDKKSDGFLGMIGFGEKSQLSVEFRVAARLLGTFIICQIKQTGSNKRVRLSSHENLELNPQASKLLPSLLTLPKSPEYLAHDLIIRNAYTFINNPEKTLAKSHTFLMLITSTLYTGHVQALFHSPF